MKESTKGDIQFFGETQKTLVALSYLMNCQQLRGCTFALSGGCTKLLTKSPQSHL
jgi:hypothetical protein